MEEKVTDNVQFFADKYCIINRVDAGNQSEKYIVRDRYTGIEYIAKAEKTVDVRLVNEIACRGVAKLADVVYHNDQCFCIYEYIKGITLDEYIKSHRLSDSDKKNICLKLLDIMDYFHSMLSPVYLCDIKPDNFMVNDDNDIFFVDLGSLKRGEDEKAEVYSTPGYYCNDLHEKYGIKSDIYSFGMIMFYIYSSIDPANINFKINTVLLDNSIKNKYIANIIKRCLLMTEADYSGCKEVMYDIRNVKLKQDYILKGIRLLLTLALALNIIYIFIEKLWEKNDITIIPYLTLVFFTLSVLTLEYFIKVKNKFNVETIEFFLLSDAESRIMLSIIFMTISFSYFYNINQYELGPDIVFFDELGDNHLYRNGANINISEYGSLSYSGNNIEYSVNEGPWERSGASGCIINDILRGKTTKVQFRDDTKKRLLSLTFCQE